MAREDASIPAQAPDDLVARRIVMRRELWDKLCTVAAELLASRGIEVSPSEVAAVALEAGLASARPEPGHRHKAIRIAATVGGQESICACGLRRTWARGGPRNTYQARGPWRAPKAAP